ncbi:MAG: GIY-YIG nuclease family protein, partial [Parcubacteria group bacterium]|nr:GIY-YIG nuclease family protein [Parcubacteria group bacterium]
MIEKKLPNSPGVYLFKDSFGRIIYVGKAASLKIRVASYWKNTEKRIKKLVQEIDSIDYKKTETVIEALILEANLIKELEPKYNIKGKDNKTFLYVLFKKERFPTPLLIRGHELEKIKKRETLYLFGPYTSASSIREALNILRNIFPWACQRAELKKRICFYYQVKKCSGVCTQQIDEKEYTKMIKNL